MNHPIEIVFYIHGISPNTEPEPHDSQYEMIHKGIAKSGVDPLWPREKDGAEWGWNYDGGKAAGHKNLSAAQRVYAERILPLIQAQTDRVPNPLNIPTRLISNNLRELMFFGFGDMFYYVSQEGKWDVRLALAEQIVKHIEHRIGGTLSQSISRPLSITILGHSAGSVIAIDFLYYVFAKKSPPNWAKGTTKTGKALNKLRTMARSTKTRKPKLRLRRLITFGSPISLLVFRNNFMVSELAADQHLEPADYGLKSQLPNQKQLTGPRWINLWDKDDLIAWPVSPLMESSKSSKQNRIVEDIYVDISDSIKNTHSSYWSSQLVYDEIAKRW